MAPLPPVPEPPHRRLPPAPDRARRAGASAGLCLALALVLVAPIASGQDEPTVDEPTVDEPMVDEQTGAEPGPTDPAGEQPEAAPPTPELLADLPLSPTARLLSGHLTLDHRYRDLAPSDHDNDLRGSLYLDLGDPAAGTWSGRVHGSAYLDLDRADPGDPGFGIGDTFDSDLTARLYEAYAQAGHVGRFERLRAGRLMLRDTPELAWFDGLEARTEELTARGLRLGLYGGVPVHPHESSPDGDALFGASAELRPWQGGRARLDYMRFEDQSLLGGFDNDLWHLDLQQLMSEGLRASGSHALLDGEPHDLRLAVDLFGDAGLLRASYYELLNDRAAAAHELDPFFGTVLDLFAYRQAQVLGSVALADELFVEGGVLARRVSDAADVGDSNRDFERAHLSLGHEDLFGFAATLTGEAWEGEDDVIRTWGVDLEREVGPDLELGLGSYFSLYKYDHLLGAERDEVRSTFVDLEYRVGRATRLDLSYEHERDEGVGEHHTVRIGLRWTF